MDRFPAAFDRFEKAVDLTSFRSGRELKYAFSHWAGRRWVDSYKQNLALRREAKKRGFKDTKLPRYFKHPQFIVIKTLKRETVTIRGKAQVRFRDIKTGRFIKKP